MAPGRRPPSAGPLHRRSASGRGCGSSWSRPAAVRRSPAELRLALGLAGRTDSHQLEQMVIDPESGLTGHLSDDGTDVLRPCEFDGLLAGAADDVVAGGKICPGGTGTGGVP